MLELRNEDLYRIASLVDINLTYTYTLPYSTPCPSPTVHTFQMLPQVKECGELLLEAVGEKMKKGQPFEAKT